MTELWKCTPMEFEEQPEDMIDLHIGIYVEELKARDIEQKRADQRRR